MVGTTRAGQAGWGTLLLALVVAGTVHAQATPTTAAAAAPDAPSAEDLAEARRIFAEGIAHADHGEWEDAVVAFRQVLEVREAPPVFYNLGAALAALNQYPEAELHLQRVVRDASADPSLVARAQAALDGMAQHGGRVTFVLGQVSPATIVYLDGIVLGRDRIGLDIPLSAGEHEISVREGGLERAHRNVRVAVGDNVEVELADTATAGAADGAATGADAARGGNDRRHRLLRSPWLWSGVGGGVVIITVVSILVAHGSSTTAPPVQGNFNPPLVRF